MQILVIQRDTEDYQIIHNVNILQNTMLYMINTYKIYVSI